MPALHPVPDALLLLLGDVPVSHPVPRDVPLPVRRVKVVILSDALKLLLLGLQCQVSRRAVCGDCGVVGLVMGGDGDGW